MYKFLHFDENILYAKDFLNLRDTKIIKEKLEANSKNENLSDLKSFSDNIFRIN